MTEAYCYILFSKKLNRHYIGSTTGTVEERLQQHLSKLYGGLSFTAKADDWEIFLEISCDALSMALKMEKFIKRMKSRAFIERLSQDDELVNSLKQRFA